MWESCDDDVAAAAAAECACVCVCGLYGEANVRTARQANERERARGFGESAAPHNVTSSYTPSVHI